MKRVAVVVLFASMIALAGAYVATFAGADPNGVTAWTFAVAMPFAFVAIIALAVARPNRRAGGLGLLAGPLLALLLLLIAAFTLALLLPTNEPLIAGVPRRAALVLYGVGLMPFLFLPLAYALTFRDMTLRDEDIDRIRRLADSRRSAVE